jgi:hypothetical protein
MRLWHQAARLFQVPLDDTAEREMTREVTQKLSERHVRQQLERAVFEDLSRRRGRPIPATMAGLGEGGG